MSPGPEELSSQDFADRVELALRASDLAAAREAAAQALATAATRAEQTRSRLLQARCDYVGGDVPAALPVALHVAAWAAQEADSATEARARALAARCLLGGGQSDEALNQALMAVRLIEVDDVADASLALLHARLDARRALGVVYLGLQQLDAALEWCLRAQHSAAELGDPVALGAAMDTVACVQGAFAARERVSGRADLAQRWEHEAVRSSTEAARIARENGHVEYEATALNNLAESLSLLGQAEQALALLEEWSGRTGCTLPRVLSHHLDTRGSVCLGLNRSVEACTWFRRALELAESDAARMTITENLARALEQCGQWQEALQRHKEFHALYVQVSSDSAQRSARIAEVRLQTERERARARSLAQRNRDLQRRAEDLERLSATDVLTGLANRRGLERVLTSGIHECCIALIDVDHFKRVNDGFSHAIGDDVLRHLAGLLREGCREGDLPVRLGGEEFVVVFSRLPRATAQATAERLRSRAETHDWGRLAPGLAVTVSIGLAFGNEADSVDTLLALADRRLYAAKHSGRNRVVDTG